MMPCAFVFALARAGKSMPAKMAMMAMTTRSSIKVNAARNGRRNGCEFIFLKRLLGSMFKLGFREQEFNCLLNLFDFFTIFLTVFAPLASCALRRRAIPSLLSERGARNSTFEISIGRVYEKFSLP